MNIPIEHQAILDAQIKSLAETVDRIIRQRAHDE